MCLRVLVTGGAGFIGSNLVRYLLRSSYCVLNVDKLTYAGNLNSLVDVVETPQYSFVCGDIADVETMHETFAAFRPDAVMHLAAESHVDRSIDGPRTFIETNVLGTFCLLQVSLEYWRGMADERKAQFRFLHVSTDEVYGSLGNTGHFSETTRYDPRSPYSATKAASDHLVRAWHHTYGLPVLVTNCSNNYGPYQFPEKLIPVVILKALRGEPIPVYGKGDNVRDWLHVEDHCRALLTVVQTGRPGETYNIGGNNELRNIDLVCMLCDILDEFQPRDDGRSFADQITFVPDRPGHDLRYAIDATKIADELNWRPIHDRQSGVRETVRWYLTNQAWWQQILNGTYRLDRLGTAVF